MSWANGSQSLLPPFSPHSNDRLIGGRGWLNSWAVPQTQIDTRQALLDAAEELFSQKGFAAVGIRQIVEKAGCNIAAINYHFGSKSDLHIQTVRRAMERPEAAAAWEILSTRPAGPQEAATAIVRFIHRFLLLRLDPTIPDIAGSLILHEAAEPSEAIESVVRDFLKPHESMLVSALGVLSPGTGPAELSLFAQSILGQILHYRVFRPFLERLTVGDLTSRKRLAQIADHIARVSLRGLGCREKRIDEAIAIARAEGPAATARKVGRTSR